MDIPSTTITLARGVALSARTLVKPPLTTGRHFTHLPEVVGDEVLLVTALAPNHHDALHKRHAIDLQTRARKEGIMHAWGLQSGTTQNKQKGALPNDHAGTYSSMSLRTMKREEA